MTVGVQLYYFVNDLYRTSGKRILMRDLDPIAKRLSVKFFLRLDKVGTPGFMSRALLRNLGIDAMMIFIEGESEEALKEALREVYKLYGPYEVERAKEYALAREMKKELP